MKTIMLGVLAVCGFNIYAGEVAEEDVFVDGTCWECSYTPIPPATASANDIVREYLVATEEGDAGGYLELYTEYDNDPATRRRIALVKKDGDKVYSKPFEEYDKWLLMYDFGIKQGEGCTVWIIPSYWTEDYNLSSYVFCLSNDRVSSVYDRRVMRLAEFDDDSFELFQGEGIWIDNLGTVRGLSENIYFEACGFSQRLQKVYNGDRVIWKNPLSGIGSVEASGLDIKLSNGQLRVDGTHESELVSVYSADGVQLVASQACGPLSVSLPHSGLFIVKVGNKIAKVVNP